MMRFGKSILYRFPSTTLQKMIFFLLGHTFIGAEIRLVHFKHALKVVRLDSHFNILDAGCGVGDFSFFIAQKYIQCWVTAYDCNKKAIEQNRSIQEQWGIRTISFVHKNLCNMKEKNRYQLVACIGTLIYFSKEKTKAILKNLSDSLTKGGYLYLDLPQEDFLEINCIPIHYYPRLYAALKHENSGDLYTLNEMMALLKELGFEIIFVNKSFSYVGKCVWELDNLLREHQLTLVRYALLPLIKFLARLDAIGKHKKGCCFVILARKG